MLVIGGVLLVALIAAVASRSGRKKGAERHQQAEADQYEAERHGDEAGEEGQPPPGPPPS